MKDDPREHVHAIQTFMVESAKSCFSDSELDDLRDLIELTVEFHDFLQYGHSDLRGQLKYYMHSLDLDAHFHPDEAEREYAIHSIFSGIDSFCRVNVAYRILVGATKSKIDWGMISMQSLKELFNSTFHRFDLEAHFEKKCRLLLDLFKIQIVFAGMLYD